MLRVFKSLPKGERQFYLCCLSQLLVIVIAFSLFVAGFPNAAAEAGGFGALFVLFGWLLYVVFVDSKERWPGVSAFKRYSNVITFKR